MNLFLKRGNAIQYSSNICLMVVVVLLTIWVLPDTIALRNVLLGIGALCAIWLVSLSKFFKNRALLEILPLILFSLIFAWAIIHFLFFSLNPELELKELKSVWFRALAGSIVAIGLCVALKINANIRPYFFTSLFIVSWINLGAYIYLSYQAGALIQPQDFVNIFVFKKIEAAFFGIIAISLACANLLFLASKNYEKEDILLTVLWLFGIVSAIISSIVANTKNGLLGSLGLCALLGIVFICKAIFIGGDSRRKLLLPALLIFFIVIFAWKTHSSFATNGWSTLFEDIKISSQIEKHNFWRYSGLEWEKPRSMGEVFPKNSRGIDVAGNTYERIAWATQGSYLIFKHPMGYGSINHSFVGMLNFSGISNQLESQTHSGWIDFGLAFGIPGIFLMAITFLSVIYCGLYFGGQFGWMGLWLIVGIAPFGLIAEICYKHNFEILLFFIAFACTSVIPIKSSRLAG